MDISVDYVLYSVRHVIHRFKEMRYPEEFKSILEEANNVLGSTDDVDGPRQSKRPRRLDDSVIANKLPIQDERDIARMRQSYYGIIDALIVSLA